MATAVVSIGRRSSREASRRMSAIRATVRASEMASTPSAREGELAISSAEKSQAESDDMAKVSAAVGAGAAAVTGGGSPAGAADDEGGPWWWPLPLWWYEDGLTSCMAEASAVPR